MPITALLLLAALSAAAQSVPDSDGGNRIGREYLKHLLQDQKDIWTSPAHIRHDNVQWLIPFVAATGGLIAVDSNVAGQLPGGPNFRSQASTASNAGVAALAGGSAAMYFFGRLAGNEDSRETGVLASEAAINSVAVAEVFKAVTGRERPQENVRGRFLQGGASFPSEHSMVAWSIASVLGHEYSNLWMRTLAYGAAGGVSFARVLSAKHFPSDVFVGSALGYVIGAHVYSSHHEESMLDKKFGVVVKDRDASVPLTGTTFVPMDSWVYPLLDRLEALGYVESGITDLRPWTRSECARLVKEAGDNLEGVHAGGEAADIYNLLKLEFAPELEQTGEGSDSRIEELYLRAGGLGGQPLGDDYHFAKTIVDDFGRPFGNGANIISGASARTVAGPFSFYVRGEYQHAGSLTPYAPLALQSIASFDQTPFALQQRAGTLDRFRFLDSYVAFNWRDNVISFGKQTLWWGPGNDAPFLFSDNAEPLPMLRISRAVPFQLPWLFRYLGAVRFELMWAQVNGHNFIQEHTDTTTTVFTLPIRPHPFVDGEKISFRPTKNFEFGLGVTTLFAGPGSPLTLHRLLKSYSISNTTPGAPDDPGDRRSAFDWSYRVPGIRDWLTFYGDSFTEDEFSPISFPRKSDFRVGLYMPKIPKLDRVELRAEGIYTDIPSLGGPGVAYFNTKYLSGYTNFGQIIGSWIGREGRGVLGWGTYHLSPRSTVELTYRSQRVNPEFLEGGYLRDLGAKVTVARAHDLLLSGTLQYEHWKFPLLSATPQTNVSAGVEVRYAPLHGLKFW